MEKTKFTAKQLAFSAIAIALATVIATYLKIKGPFWVNGGSITLFSMLIIVLPGYFYGPVTGLVAALAYGILQFVTEPYVVHPLQVLLDYPLAFGALGLAGFFHKNKNGLLIGYIVGVLGRLFFHCVSGVIFYTEFVGESAADAAAIWAGIVYNMSYIIPEAVMSIVLILIPPVAKALKKVKQMSGNEQPV
ncbi:MAG: energy-coupled thiamine transporter ThiT [Lachnospiraceae bacterium]|nr:energy-coupled thiamine transporter ThiT [Lachnospiraceae bacterium]